MDYFEQEVKLQNLLEKKLGNYQAASDVLSQIDAIGSKYEMTSEEMGYLYGATSSLVQKEMKVNEITDFLSPEITSTREISEIVDSLVEIVKKAFSEGNKEKIFEDGDEKMTAVVAIADKAQKIGDKFGLNSEQKIQLEKITRDIVDGKEQLTNFRAILVDKLGLTYDQALKIAFEANSQIFNAKPKQGQTVETVNKVEIRKEAATKPEQMIPDHEVMVKTDGPHAHSQTVAPTQMASRPLAPAAAPTPAFAPSNLPTGAMPENRPRFTPSTGSIVDQKLSGLVRNSGSAPIESRSREEIEKARKEMYKERDPYREPLE